MRIGHTADSWTDAVRREAFIAVQLAAAKRIACEHAFVYFLRTAQSHGLTVAELAEAAGITESEVERLTEPAAA